MVLNRSALSSAVLATALLNALVACADDKGATGATDDASASPARALALYDLGDTPAGRWKLPKKLREISGLATSDDGRVFAHDDERAVVYELDIANKDIVKQFSIGEKRVKDDLEGIAVAEGSIFLVASNGALYEAPEGEDKQRVEFTRHDTGVGKRCEVEGLAYDAYDRTLLLVCKTMRGSESKDFVTVFRWSLHDRRLAEPESIRIPERGLRRFGLRGNAHPSGIARHPANGNYLILAGRERAVLEVTPRGELVGAVSLQKGRHRRAEGIELLPTGDGDYALLISDEGDGRRARITRYDPGGGGRAE